MIDNDRNMIERFYETIFVKEVHYKHSIGS